MPRRQREDFPGSIQHIRNVGMARRTTLESRDDIRYFLSLLAREVRRGLIEVLAFCLLTTHFHLVLRSVTGEISRALQSIQNRYVRRFNRQRRRDGSLFRGRFGSSIVDSDAYWRCLIRYVDNNAVDAGLVDDPRWYPYGSAYHYARLDGPIWLARKTIEEMVMFDCGSPVYTPELYVKSVGLSISSGERWLVERRFSGFSGDHAPIDDLLSAAPDTVLDWMRRKSRLADGTAPGQPVASPATIESFLYERAEEDRDWVVRPPRKSRSGWDLLRTGLLREAAGLSLAEIARRCGTSPSSVSRAVAAHCALIERDDLYSERAARLLSSAMNADFGKR